MKNLILFLLLAAFGKNVEGQLMDKAVFFGGFNYQLISLTPEGSPVPSRIPFYGLGVGMDYVLMQSNDQFSVGLNPNANFSFVFSSNYGHSLLAQAPVYLLGRIGAGATPYNEQKVGVGAGIGAVYTYMVHSTIAYDQFGNSLIARLKEGWVNPSAIVEFGLNTRRSNYLFRLNWSLLQPTKAIESLGGYNYSFAAGALSIMYKF